MCPSYDFSLSKNDYYRMGKAMTYAIATQGRDFRLSENSKNKKDESEYRAALKDFVKILKFVDF